ncbi:hypothetical protein C5B94_03965 [Clavibacter michiganensis]|uniref:hypothetical protein n=1 Tax=Clavibacter michiganensis TaxID=28447 RepID=UPI000CE8E663|nr:hypothetical protein [Clavibacter michiganensis]PPF56085.1 hypothetical protein C5B94_03965 [Clavibacter michiganensis]
MATSKTTPTETTTLDSDITKPSVTAPGDGPADTTDPTEVAHSVTPQPGAEAIKVGTVNAVVKGTTPAAKPTSDPRIETYEALNPKGEKVTVELNLETGVSTIKK